MLVVVGLVIRMKLMESPIFQKVQESDTKSRMPIVDVVKEHPRDVLTAMGMRVAENGIFYVYTVFFLAYGEDTLKVSEETMLIGVIIVASSGSSRSRSTGACRTGSDASRCTWPARSCRCSCASRPSCWPTRSPAILIWLAMILGINVGHDLMYGPQAAYFAELFGTRHRYSGASLGYQLASVFAGGFAPLIAAALLTAGGDEPWLVAAYMSGLAMITIVATAFARETYRDRIDEDVSIAPSRRFERETARETEPVR